jgi:hypothetical protein
MSKTKMSESKRKALLPLVYKKIIEKYPEYDIDNFTKKWKERFAEIFDNVIKEYYGERFVGEYDWLLSQGLLHNRQFHISCTPKNSFGDIENNVFRLQFENWFGPSLMYGIGKKDSVDESIEDCIGKVKRNLEVDNVYAQSCQRFCDGLLEIAKPILKMINGATHCEDILEVWDTMEVRKVLFPEKVYPVSTLTAEDMKALKKFFK